MSTRSRSVIWLLRRETLGTEHIIFLDRHADRITLAKEFGATDIVSERGDAAIERVLALTNGLGAHLVLKCVGYEESTRTALSIARAGGVVGRVGVPQDEAMPVAMPTFFRNVTISVWKLKTRPR